MVPAYFRTVAVRALLPWEGRGLEIGVGTGRFAGPLGVKFGIDPAGETLSYALTRGVSVARAVAEALPFAEAVFDYALVVTTICFVDDARAMLLEIARVLRPGGSLVIGLIDRESALGKEYVAHREENVFTEARPLLGRGGRGAQETVLALLAWVQTLSTPLSEIREIEPISAGSGRAAFLVVRAQTSGEAEAGRDS
jgi:SAM-dependent methyltransferase